VVVLTVLSICRELSAVADDLDAYGEAFGITLVSRREILATLAGVVDGQAVVLLARDDLLAVHAGAASLMFVRSPRRGRF